MTEHFCTYFDHRYVAKGLAMWRSLKQSCDSAVLHVLCLNEPCRQILTALRLPDVRLISVWALEASDTELRRVRDNRSLIEYYFTMTPCLPLYLFKSLPDVSRVTYVDADLFFFADPQPIFDEVGQSPVGIIEHRFPDDLVDFEKHGRFNVGWLTFQRDPVAFECLNSWRQQCLEWCYDRVEPGRFAEQKYLDEWPARFPGIHVVQHKGANLAPWNLRRFRVDHCAGRPRVDNDELIFFHAHGFQPASPGRVRELNLADYRVEKTAVLDRLIFDPYEKALLEATAEIALPLTLVLLSDQPRHTAYLREALEASEADRVARLAAIHTLQRELETVNVDRAARLEAIQALQRRLDESEADRAARLEVIHDLQLQLDANHADGAARENALHQQLEATEADRVSRENVIHDLQFRLEQLDERLKVAERDRAAREKSIAALEQDLGSARSRVDALEHSRSWRWTRPARQLASRLLKKGPPA
jgi:hypothetical protein